MTPNVFMKLKYEQTLNCSSRISDLCSWLLVMKKTKIQKMSTEASSSFYGFNKILSRTSRTQFQFEFSTLLDFLQHEKGLLFL